MKGIEDEEEDEEDPPSSDSGAVSEEEEEEVWGDPDILNCFGVKFMGSR